MSVNPEFTPEPGHYWGYWRDPDVINIATGGPWTVAAEGNPAGRQLAIDAITYALADGNAERRTP